MLATVIAETTPAGPPPTTKTSVFTIIHTFVIYREKTARIKKKIDYKSRPKFHKTFLVPHLNLDKSHYQLNIEQESEQNYKVESDQRRLYLNNWALMTSDNRIMWSFGDINQEKQEMTLDFITALSKLGHEIWGKDQSIGTIRLRYATPHPSHAREIMIIDLHREYNIVISDPLVTTRLMSKITVDNDQSQNIDNIRSILAGSAAVTYSKFFSEGSSLEPSIVDEIFQEAVTAVTYNKQVTVGNGECSFSALSVEELLFFHALLKSLFETHSHHSSFPQTKPWGVVHSSTGAQVYLEHEPPIDGALISAFASVTATYCNLLFSAYPARLVFG
ncbi:MAG: hypothetical protein ACXABG_08205, partial [Promethearchaeota archaeon]